MGEAIWTLQRIFMETCHLKLYYCTRWTELSSGNFSPNCAVIFIAKRNHPWADSKSLAQNLLSWATPPNKALLSSFLPYPHCVTAGCDACRGPPVPTLPFFFLDFWICFFRDRVSLYSPGCPGTHSVDQAGLELRNLPASASQVLGL